MDDSINGTMTLESIKLKANDEKVTYKLDSLSNMKNLLDVVDELRLDESGRDVDLTTNAERHLLFTMVDDFRVAGPDSPLRKCKVFLFNDLLIVGKYQKYKGKAAMKIRAAEAAKKSKTKSKDGNGDTKKKKKEESDGNGSDSDPVIFGEVLGGNRAREDDEMSDNTGLDTAEKEKLEKLKQEAEKKIAVRLELRMWLDLAKVNIRTVHNLEHNVHGVTVSYTFSRKKKGRDGKYVYRTEGKSKDFWCKDEETALQLIDPIIAAKDVILRADIVKREKDLAQNKKDIEAAKGTGKRVPRMRSHMHKQVKYKKFQAAKNRHAGSRKKEGSLMDFEPDVRLSWQQMHERYGLVVSKEGEEKHATLKEDKAVIFDITFETGKLGLRLSSHEDVGVYVAVLTSTGLAYTSGVGVGDRVLEINGKYIPRDRNWKDCLVELSVRPLTIKFTRTNLQDERYMAEKYEREKQLELEVLAKGGTEDEAAKMISKMPKSKWREVRTHHEGLNLKLINHWNEVREELDALEKDRFARHPKSRVRVIEDMFAARIGKEKKEWGWNYKPNEYPEERQCLYQLEETWKTERTFVTRMIRVLFEFQKPLEKMMYTVVCRDLPHFGVNICPHGKDANECGEFSDREERVMNDFDSKKIFLNLSTIISVNKKMLDTVEDDLSALSNKLGPEKVPVSEIVRVFEHAFVPFAPFLRLYTSFAQHYTSACVHLGDMLKWLPFGNAFKEIPPIEKWRLQDLLHQPIMRLTKYPLLFDNLIDKISPYAKSESDILSDKKAGESIEGKLMIQFYGENNPDFTREHMLTAALDRIDRLIDNGVSLHDMYHSVADGVEDFVKDIARMSEMVKVYNRLGGDEDAIDLMNNPTRMYKETFEDVKCQFDNETKLTPIVLFVYTDIIVGAVQRVSTWRKKMLPQRKTLIAGRDHVQRADENVQPKYVKGTKFENPEYEEPKLKLLSKKTEEQMKESSRQATLRIVLWLKLRKCNKIAMIDDVKDNRMGFNIYFALSISPGDTYKKKKYKGTSPDVILEIYGFWFLKDDTDKKEKPRSEIRKKAYDIIVKFRDERKDSELARKKAAIESGMLPKPRYYLARGEGGKPRYKSPAHDRINALKKVVKAKERADKLGIKLTKEDIAAQKAI